MYSLALTSSQIVPLPDFEHFDYFEMTLTYVETNYLISESLIVSIATPHCPPIAAVSRHGSPVHGRDFEKAILKEEK